MAKQDEEIKLQYFLAEDLQRRRIIFKYLRKLVCAIHKEKGIKYFGACFTAKNKFLYKFMFSWRIFRAPEANLEWKFPTNIFHELKIKKKLLTKR